MTYLGKYFIHSLLKCSLAFYSVVGTKSDNIKMKKSVSFPRITVLWRTDTHTQEWWPSLAVRLTKDMGAAHKGSLQDAKEL